jgi:hypothetical protein
MGLKGPWVPPETRFPALAGASVVPVRCLADLCGRLLLRWQELEACDLA